MNKTLIEPEEILSEVVFPVLPERAVSSFVKLGRRNSLTISRLSMGAILMCNEEGLIEDVRLTLGAMGPKPIRAIFVEEKLKGRRPEPPLLEEAIAALSETVSLNLGNRASEPYKKVAVRGVARKVLCNVGPRFGCE
jgi:carbon-monoxide dehydrogenase medium subunit